MPSMLLNTWVRWEESENPAASVRTMRSALERYWTIERIRHLDPEDVDLVRGDGETRYLEYQYEARVPLPEAQVTLYAGLRGRAKIDAAEWQTLASRFWRLLTRTFHFRI